MENYKNSKIGLETARKYGDILEMERHILQVERKCGRSEGSTRMMAAIESAKGVINAPEIAKASPRLIGIALGAAEFFIVLARRKKADLFILADTALLALVGALSLALGMADQIQAATAAIHLDVMFIDEGFGSLDADTLQVAMAALDSLQAQGRKVGVISHVQEMTERIGVRIHVQRESSGQSRIEVRG
jgi:hypothetical protein